MSASTGARSSTCRSGSTRTEPVRNLEGPGDPFSGFLKERIHACDIVEKRDHACGGIWRSGSRACKTLEEVGGPRRKTERHGLSV